MKTLKTILIALSLAATTFAAQADERVNAVSASTLGVAASGSTTLFRPMPEFPVAANRWAPASRPMTSERDNREQPTGVARVVLAYEVAADGTVKDVQVVSADRAQAFARSAKSAVQKWRYVPGATDKRMVEFTFVRD